MKPLAIDLFCGLGGWTEGLLLEGYNVVGFDIERHVYCEHSYPAQLVIQDVLTIHGSQFKDAALIVASPPCQAYSYRAMPWKRAKALPPPDNSLFEACFRIQREASEASGRYIPLVVENVRGAQKWVGRSRYHFGSFHLWGDVPALMPMTKKAIKVPTMGAGWYPPDHPKHVPGLAFNGHAERIVREDIKGHGGAWFKDAATADGKYGPGNFRNGVEGRSVEEDLVMTGDGPVLFECAGEFDAEGLKQPGISGPRENGKGDAWFQDGAARHGSKSTARKAASAMIAKIPLVLSRHIAKAWHPEC